MNINEKLKTTIMDRKGSFPKTVNPFVRSVALWRASLSDDSRVQVRASYLHEIVRSSPIEIEPDWALAGNHLATACAPQRLPDPSAPEDIVLMQELGVPQENIQSVCDAVTRWHEGARNAREEARLDDLRGAGS